MLFTRAGFEAHVSKLSGTHVVRQWGDSSVAKLGPRIYAMLRPPPGAALLFKCSETSFLLLPEIAGCAPAPYLARAKWIEVKQGAPLTEKELEGYLGVAHRLIGLKLTRRERAALGL